MLAFYSNYYEVKAMRAPRVPGEEQYRLIMECRKSGLSDHQWCLNNDINSGTFYNWVKRLRKNGCGDIPVCDSLFCPNSALIFVRQLLISLPQLRLHFRGFLPRIYFTQ